jgi:hypothetical protein
MTFEPLPILETLHRHDVQFVLIGGMAGSAHGSPSITTDLDVCYQRDRENLERLAAALRELDAKLRGVDDEVPFLLDAMTLRAGDRFTFETKYGSFDILGTPSGTHGYDDLMESAQEMDLDGLTIQVAALDDLIAMKHAAGRPKDRVEVEILVALREETEKRQAREGTEAGPR